MLEKSVRRNAARFQIENLERRRLLSNVQPAFANQIGLTNVVNAETSFEDNFDGNALDPSRWQVREGPRWRNVPGTGDFNWTHRDAVRVGNGQLTLTAYTDPATGLSRSGWIQTGDNFSAQTPPGQPDPKLVPGYSGDFEQQYGYWEARMKVNAQVGMWTGFWVHSYKMVDILDDPATANHPEIYGTEYDVAESASIRNGAPAANDVSTVVHANGYHSLHRSSGVNTNASWLGPNYTGPSDWHVYGLLWTPSEVRFYLDGNLVQRETDPALISKVPQVGILSTEVGAGNSKLPNTGNNYFGVPPAAGYGTLDTSNAKLTADYVRVWQLRTVTPPPVTPPVTPPAPPPAGAASVVGVVYNDLDANGRRDNGEPGLANVTAYLDLNYNGRRETNEPAATTDGTGAYRFNNVAAGGAAVRLSLGATTLAQTFPVRDDALWFTIDTPREYSMFAFGVSSPAMPIPPTPPINGTAVVTGSVFLDANWNARRDTNESGQANVRVFLDLNGNARRDADEPTTLTATTGTYRFDTVRPATSLVVRMDLSGTAIMRTTPGGDGGLWLAVAAGATYADQTFGVWSPANVPIPPPPAPTSPAVVTGTVFADYNRNAWRDSGDVGIGYAVVYIDADNDGYRDNDESFATTLVDGTFRFSNLAAGTYLFRLDTRASWYTPTLGTGGLWKALVGGATTSVDFAVIAK